MNNGILDTAPIQNELDSAGLLAFIFQRYYTTPPHYLPTTDVFTNTALYDEKMILLQPDDLNRIVTLGYWYLDEGTFTFLVNIRVEITVIKRWVSLFFSGLPTVRHVT